MIFKNDIGNRTSSRLIRSVITHGSRKAAHITDQNNSATVLSSLTVHKFRLTAMCLVNIKIKMIGMLLNFVHRQVLKNIQQRNLTGFITVPLYQLQYGVIKKTNWTPATRSCDFFSHKDFCSWAIRGLSEIKHSGNKHCELSHFYINLTFRILVKSDVK